VIELARRSYYYRPVVPRKRDVEDADIRDRLEALALEFPRYGYRRMTAQLRADGLRVNHKRVLRIMRQGHGAPCPLSVRSGAGTSGRPTANTACRYIRTCIATRFLVSLIGSGWPT